MSEHVTVEECRQWAGIISAAVVNTALGDRIREAFDACAATIEAKDTTIEALQAHLAERALASVDTSRTATAAAGRVVTLMESRAYDVNDMATVLSIGDALDTCRVDLADTLRERDASRAECERLRALLDEAQDELREHCPGHGVLISNIGAALGAGQ